MGIKLLLKLTFAEGGDEGVRDNYIKQPRNGPDMQFMLEKAGEVEACRIIDFSASPTWRIDNNKLIYSENLKLQTAASLYSQL